VHEQQAQCSELQQHNQQLSEEQQRFEEESREMLQQKDQELSKQHEQIQQLSQKRQRPSVGSTPPSLKGTHVEPRKSSVQPTPRRAFDKSNPQIHDLYLHVMQLDNQLAERERTVSQLSTEKAELERRNKDLDTAYRKVASELQKERLKRDDVIDTSRASLLERIRKLEARETRLTRELQSVRTVERAKTSSIGDMERKLGSIDELTTQVRHLEGEVRSRDAIITKLRAHGRTLKLELQRNVNQLQRVDDSNQGIPYHLWQAERSKLQVHQPTNHQPTTKR
jgi:hypothetical protein